MAKAKKKAKKRAETYDPKLKITGSFEDVIKVSMTNPNPPKANKNEKHKK